MGGVVYVTPYASAVDNVLLNQTAANIQGQMAAAAMANQMMANRQAAMNQRPRRPDEMFGNMIGSARTEPLSKSQPSVSATAASRVQKAEWELEYDRKDREVDDMIERQRQERERVRIEEENGNDPRGED